MSISPLKIAISLIAIMLFSSTLTIMGQISFLNNRGYQGGALRLVQGCRQVGAGGGEGGGFNPPTF